MPTPNRTLKFATLAAAAAAAITVGVLSVPGPAAEAADAVPEAAIRKGLTERVPTLKIDEVRATPMTGLYEVRMGHEVLYTDAEGGFIVRGELLDLKAKRNLTEERVNKLNMIEFASLPLKDAVVWKTGSGARKIAVFADPNCGYCKRFEQELNNVKDLTVYTFIIPILGGDSPEKSKAIWCAKDSAAAWRSWMIDNVAPPKAAEKCSAPMDRNLELSRKHRVNGTPAIVFEDGTRVPGMINAQQLEKQLAGVGKS